MNKTGKVRPQPQQAKIVKVVKETKDTSTLTLEFENPIVWQPGQFIMVAATIDGQNVRRAYSIASSPTREYLEIAIRQTETPTMSKYLNERMVGDTLEVKGPYGKFIWTESVSKSLVCLAAGSGITPFRAFLQYFIDKKLDNDYVLLYSCRYGDNVIFEKQLTELVKQVPNSRYELSITRDAMGLNYVRNGRINKEYLQQINLEYPESNYYLCGSPGFVSTLIKELIELGVDKSRIKREQWG